MANSSKDILADILKKRKASQVALQKNKTTKLTQENAKVNNENRIINQYESIPDYNVLERTFDKDKRQQYNTKQMLFEDYSKAKNRQTEQFILDNNITNEQLENLWLGNNGKYKSGSDVDKAIQLVKSLGGDYDALVKYYDDTVNKKAVQNVADATSNNVLSAIGMNALSALGNTASNAGYAVNSGLNYFSGKPIGEAPTLDMELNQAIRSTTKDMIDKSTNGSAVGNKLANTAYDVGMGVADFGGALALGGGNPTMTLGFQTASGVGGATYDAKQRGLTDKQAIGEGAVSGGAELLLGQLPLDVLTKTNADDALLKTILKQGASEALEEGGTSAVNAIADTLIAGENSNYELKKQTYLSMGMSVEDAEKHALADTLKEVGYEGLVGGLSGGLIGGINKGVQNVANRNAQPINELEPIADTQAEMPLSEAVSRNKATETQQPTNTEPVNENALNLQIQSNNKESNVVDKFTDNVNMHMEPYTDNQKKSWVNSKKIVLYENKAQLKQFIEDAKNRINAGKKLYFGKVKKGISERVKNELNIDISNHNCALYSDNIRKIFKDHGVEAKENTRGQRAIEIDDFSKIPEIIDNPDSIESGGLYNNQPVIKFTKNGITVIGVVTDGALDLYTQTMYASNKNRSLATAIDEQTPINTPETTRSTASNNSISNYTENVNTINQNVVPDLSNMETINPYSSTENIQSNNQRVRSYNDTLINKTDAPQELKNEFIENPQIYTQLSNKATLESAMDILNNNDLNTAMTEYRKMLDEKNPTAIPLGYNISKQLVAEGRFDESVQVIRDMSKALTESGQFSQAAAITMMNNDPEAAKRYLLREIDTLNQKGAEKYGNKWNNFELTENELKRFNDIQPGDTEAIQQLYQDVYNRLSKAYPSTMTEKLLEYRRIAMLLNVRTNVRNVVSNALLFPVRWTADRVAALGEGAYSLINPKYFRTQSINPIRSKQSKKLAAEAFNTVKEELLGTNKYEDSKGAIRDRQVFKGTALSRAMDNVLNGAITKANQAMGKDVNPSLMETARNFTYYLLQKGDDVFVRKNFESRMASYLDAQGITDLESIPADAYMLATQEAMKATFKDDSSFANGLSEFRRMLNKIPGGFVGEAIMPFTKTPANLAMRGIDYSPIGIYNGVKTLAKAKSQTDVANGITQLGQAVTGTAAIALGYVLAELGLVTGALSEDKDEAQFQKQQGMLPYAFNINGNYFTYDWAQPASIPLILGVTIYDSWNNEKDFLNGVKSGSLAAVDSWLELSPLQNLSDIFGGYGTPAENVWDVLATDLPLSFLPSQMNAIAKTTDTTQRTTYSPDYWENLTNQAKVKVPGMSESLPVSYDTWGNPIERQDNAGEAFFANFINPGQFGNDNITSIDDEISELYEDTKDVAVFPKKASWTVNGTKLDNEQYSEYQRIMGSESYDMAAALIESKHYNKLDDEQRVNAISNMYNFADALAKHEVIGYDVEGSNTYKKTYSVYKEKGAKGVAEYLAIKELTEGSKNYQIVEAVDGFNMSDKDKGYYISVLVNSMSKAANEAYESGGYAAVYKHYMEATEEDRRESANTYLDPFFSY